MPLYTRMLATAALIGWFAAAAAASLQAPAPQTSPQSPDVIVVGAGLSGLTAAVEMGRAGVNVLVVDMNSVAGGHAVLAGGVALVGTPVQERAGITDSPDLAYRDWMDWTEDADPEWTRFYVENSRTMIYDWATQLGVEFVRAGQADGNSVPRFHFTRGRALHLVMPIFRTALALPSVSFLWNARAERLVITNGRVDGVVVRHLRTGTVETLRAKTTVLATGGFESDLKRVLANWTPRLPRPDSLLIGSAISATGSGHDMATTAGAAMSRIDRHYIYIDGMVDPRDPLGTHALTAGNDSSIWVNAQGQRFTNERGFDKAILADLVKQKPSTYWMIFDEETKGDFSVRGAAWVSNPSQTHPILDNPKAASKADTIEELAAKAGLPPDALAATVRRYNGMIEDLEDADFRRFEPGDLRPPRIRTPPFYAVRMYPMTRKNMGGVSIDRQARVLNQQGQVVPGLYAAGELTGSVGINGSHGLDGLFLGPALLTGRLAGISLAATYGRTGESRPAPRAQAAAPQGPLPAMNANSLTPLLAKKREGYWHFEMAHGIVRERGYACTRCHSTDVPYALPATTQQRVAQIEICANCH